MGRRKILIVCFLSWIATGCAKLETQNFPMSLEESLQELLSRTSLGTCDRRNVSTINLCMEAVGSDYNDPQYLGFLKSSCESSGGTFSANRCDTMGSLGTCVVGARQSNVTYVSYYPPQYTAETARQDCTQTAGGIFFTP